MDPKSECMLVSGLAAWEHHGQTDGLDMAPSDLQRCVYVCVYICLCIVFISAIQLIFSRTIKPLGADVCVYMYTFIRGL